MPTNLMLAIKILFKSQNELQKTFWTLGKSFSTNGENWVGKNKAMYIACNVRKSNTIQCLLEQCYAMFFKSTLCNVRKSNSMQCLSKQSNPIFFKATLRNVRKSNSMQCLSKQSNPIFFKATLRNVC